MNDEITKIRMEFIERAALGNEIMNEFEFKAWLINRIDFLNSLVELKEGVDITFINGQLTALNGILKEIENGSFEG